MLCASKEAAYKAFKQRDSQLVFQHSEFIVDRALKSVRFKEETIKLRVKHEGEMIFALACDSEHAAIYTSIEKLPRAEDSVLERARGRAMILELCAHALGLPESELSLSFNQRIPSLCHLGQNLAHCISISHHGYWVTASLGVSSKSEN
jgi:phosphopantetheinyl transferase (holo-ACP synthase)